MLDTVMHGNLSTTLPAFALPNIMHQFFKMFEHLRKTNRKTD